MKNNFNSSLSLYKNFNQETPRVSDGETVKKRAIN